LDKFESGGPPPRGRIPEAWYQEALTTAAQRDPRRAMAVARVIESTLLDPHDPEVNADVTRLTAWLRSVQRDVHPAKQASVPWIPAQPVKEWIELHVPHATVRPLQG
jgi:hypothetical protein